MSDIFLKKIILEKIHNRYNLSIEFNETLNILHGRNGAGKSTLIHVIANVVNCDFVRFAFLNFEKIEIYYNNGKKIIISQSKDEKGRHITITLGSEEFFTFSVADAYSAVKEVKDEKYHINEPPPFLLRRISEFSKKHELKMTNSSYFPAFRTMLEAWGAYPESSYERRYYKNGVSSKRFNSFARELFGQFMPDINYPAPVDIEDGVKEEIRRAQMGIARFESRIFSDSFVKVFSALIRGNSKEEIVPDTILQDIEKLTISQENTVKINYYEEYSKIYSEIRTLINNNINNGIETSVSGALAVYRDALKERLEYQERAYSEIDSYFNSVNSFLDEKEIAYEFDIEKRNPKVGLKFPDNTWSSIKVMSSGERQLLTMLYAASRMSKDAIVLIDEPEISLHIDWQEELLENMLSQLSGRQIIICTHSPSIATGYEDKMIPISPQFVSSLNGKVSSEFEEEE
ncbi:AAA family ATPase [Pragia fontium]|uniref:AAA family ATPase n=1 Tax=Pragia fontium TaxID=82985 RepID=UPI000F6B3B09|nr:AAA family ATPase [Pragia fontium]VEJ54962.1 hemin importer ATP-binding subunit [Pragia fontium]